MDANGLEKVGDYEFNRVPKKFGFQIDIYYKGAPIGFARFMKFARNRLYLQNVSIKPSHRIGRTKSGFVPMLKVMNMARRIGAEMGARHFEFGYMQDSRPQFKLRKQGSFGGVSLRKPRRKR